MTTTYETAGDLMHHKRLMMRAGRDEDRIASGRPCDVLGHAPRRLKKERSRHAATARALSVIHRKRLTMHGRLCRN